MINSNSEILAICHPEWRGIKAATKALVPNIMEVGVILSMEEANTIAQKIKEISPKKVVLSGYPKGYDLLAKAIKTVSPQIRIFFISHTSFTWYFNRLEEVSWLENMFKAYEEGYIEKIGFVKKDPAIYFKEKGFNTFFLLNRLPITDPFVHKLNTDSIQIGVWGSDMWHRNLLNQTIAGLMVKDSHVHTNQLPDYFFIDNKRVTKHGVLPPEEYAKVMQSMDVNLYVSFTDCFPMTVVESMTNGIPCLVSDTSEIYQWSDYLKKNLIISKIDSPVAIKDKVLWVLENYSEVQEEIKNYLPVLQEQVEKSIADFLV